MKTFEDEADGLLDVMEQTIHAQVLKQLEDPLHDIVRSAVRGALTTAAIRRPIDGGRCREVWDALDAVQLITGEVPSLKDAKQLAKRKNWNENTARIQYYRWRKEIHVHNQG